MLRILLRCFFGLVDVGIGFGKFVLYLLVQQRSKGEP